ncbi:MAG: DEAD/DEAH box helicase family protein [Phycisphaeraceae bacterium]|nr:DEAD/DEAH box helicase family protein [Phycisphaeraceae bacterium]
MKLFAPGSCEATPLTLRPYQQEAVEAVYRHLREREDNPCVVIPTGGGKTPVIATICSDAVGLWNGRVLILAHVRELLEQAREKLERVCPQIDVGVYSAGLGRRDVSYAVILAGIQSVYQKADRLGHFDLVIVDEAHMIPPGEATGGGGEGMYRRLLADMRRINPHLRVIGLTATPFRMSSGPICVPAPEGILNAICYEVGVRELIRDGYLSPLKSKAGVMKADLSDLHIRGGEFVAGEVEERMDQDLLVFEACKEIVGHVTAGSRRSCLIFASGVKHGRHVAKMIEQVSGKECGFIDGETAGVFRDQMIQRFRQSGAKGLRYLCNVNVLTTGFDAPNVDCVALLRPTMSPGLYYQMVGRGFRTCPGKTDCLVLDFGSNVMRHGPVDAIRVEDPHRKGTGEAPVKECPECHALIATGFQACPECGFAFPSPETLLHQATASNTGVLSGEVTVTEYPVQDVYFSVHQKRGAPAEAPRSMRVEYRVGFNDYHSEWVCFEHAQGNYARMKAEAWWKQRSNVPVPVSAEEAVELAQAGALADTQAITVRHVAGEKYERIVDYRLGPKPAGGDGNGTCEWDRASVEPDYVPVADDEVPF